MLFRAREEKDATKHTRGRMNKPEEENVCNAIDLSNTN